MVEIIIPKITGGNDTYVLEENDFQGMKHDELVEEQGSRPVEKRFPSRVFGIVNQALEYVASALAQIISAVTTSQAAATTANNAKIAAEAALAATEEAATGAGVTDGDKGGVIVSESGTIWYIKEIGGVAYLGFILNGLVDAPFIAPFNMTITSIAVHVADLTLDVTFEDASAVAYEFNTGQTALPVTTTESVITPDTPIVLSKYEQLKVRFSNVDTGAKDFIAIFYGTRNV
jgi:hypothetical protein